MFCCDLREKEGKELIERNRFNLNQQIYCAAEARSLIDRELALIYIDANGY